MGLRLASLIATVAAAILVHGPDASAQSGSALVSFPKSELAIVSDGVSHRFKVEVARTVRQKTQGLMFRRTLAGDAGMLFVYSRPVESAMWMRNTLIPLDMLFIGDGGLITHIAQRTVPMSEDVISSGGRVRAVLEINAGTVSRLAIKPGDRVISPELGTGEVPR